MLLSPRAFGFVAQQQTWRFVEQPQPNLQRHHYPSRATNTAGNEQNIDTPSSSSLADDDVLFGASDEGDRRSEETVTSDDDAAGQRR